MGTNVHTHTQAHKDRQKDRVVQIEDVSLDGDHRQNVKPDDRCSYQSLVWKNEHRLSTIHVL